MDDPIGSSLFDTCLINYLLGMISQADPCLYSW